MKGIPQGRYTREFRQEAVKLVIEEKLSMPEAGRRLSLPPSTLGYWVKTYKAGKLGDIGKMYRPLTAYSGEIRPRARAKVATRPEESGRLIGAKRRRAWA